MAIASSILQQIVDRVSSPIDHALDLRAQTLCSQLVFHRKLCNTINVSGVQASVLWYILVAMKVRIVVRSMMVNVA
jgi:hypothetical protein